MRWFTGTLLTGLSGGVLIGAGAKVLAGGASAGEGETREYPPTVVSVNSDDTPLMSDETFGPVLPIALTAPRVGTNH